MLNIFKKKKKTKDASGIKPRGISYSVIPQNWPDGNKNPVWDSKNPLHKNKIYL